MSPRPAPRSRGWSCRGRAPPKPWPPRGPGAGCPSRPGGPRDECAARVEHGDGQRVEARSVPCASAPSTMVRACSSVIVMGASLADLPARVHTPVTRCTPGVPVHTPGARAHPGPPVHTAERVHRPATLCTTPTNGLGRRRTGGAGRTPLCRESHVQDVTRLQCGFTTPPRPLSAARTPRPRPSRAATSTVGHGARPGPPPGRPRRARAPRASAAVRAPSAARGGPPTAAR